MAGELWQSISGNFDRFSEIICEFVDNALSNFRKCPGSPDQPEGAHVLGAGGWVDVDVIDTGTGILTSRHPHRRQPLRKVNLLGQNEHGMGASNTPLASVDDSGCVWSIQPHPGGQRAGSAPAGRGGPTDWREAPMMGQYRAGWGKLIRLGRRSPSAAPISGLRPEPGGRPGGKRAFDTLVEILVEELAYTYSPGAPAGAEMTLEVDGGKQTCVVRPLFPI